MEDLIIEATKSCPAIHFKAASGELEIRGESYPEHAAKFYEPVLQWVRQYLGEGSRPLTLTVDMIYFNSSSSKVLMYFFDMLEAAAADGRQITVCWRYHEENEIALECGEDFKEEARFVDFRLISYGDDES